MVSADPSMDFEDKLFPLVGWDALHEYSQRTSFVEPVVDGNECLGLLSDSSPFSPVSWEDLFEDVGEQRHPPVGRVECHHCRVRTPERSVGVGPCWCVGAPEHPVGVRLCPGRILPDAGGWLVEVIYKNPIQGQAPSGCQFHEEVSGIILLSWDVVQLDPSELVF